MGELLRPIFRTLFLLCVVVAQLVGASECSGDSLLARPGVVLRFYQDSIFSGSGDGITGFSFQETCGVDSWDDPSWSGTPCVASSANGAPTHLRYLQNNGYLPLSFWWRRFFGSGTNTNIVNGTGPTQWPITEARLDGGFNVHVFTLQTNDCATATCGTGTGGRCTAQESMDNYRAMLLDAFGGSGANSHPEQYVVVMKMPTWVGMEGQTASDGDPTEAACADALFDESATPSSPSLDYLFEQDPTWGGHARLLYYQDGYQDWCTGLDPARYPGCPAADGLGDRRQTYSELDPGELGYVDVGGIHASQWGHGELAAHVMTAVNRVIGAIGPTEEWDLRPMQAAVPQAVGTTSSSITVYAAAGVDPDSKPFATPQVFVWATCADLAGTSTDPNCSTTHEHWCGDAISSDYTGDFKPDPFQPANKRAGNVTIPNLYPSTRYKVCSVTFDGLRASTAVYSYHTTAP